LTTSLGNSTTHTKKNLYLSFSNYSKKLKRRKDFQIHFLKPPSPLIPKLEKDYKKKAGGGGFQASIFNEYSCKNSQQNISKSNPMIHKKDHTP